MRLENINTSKIIPYENNPRHNDEAVEYVANSIKEFGFKVPIIIDKNNVIVTGHTRLKAAQALGIDKVPCIRADDLNEEQIKAFRIADNSVSDIAKWDFEKLSIEIEDIDFDMSDFGLLDVDIPNEPLHVDDEDGWYGDERERTNKAYNLDEAKEMELTNDFWQMPTIRNDNFIPERLIGFNYAKTSSDKNTGIHFYVDDYQFERVWNYPDKYIDTLIQYDCILSPDFSLYMDMPMPMKIWNVYRSRFIGSYFQRKGLKVIPTISWAENDTFRFCFKGVETGSIVSVSTIGVKEDENALEVWRNGMAEMISQIKPSAILVYGGVLDFDYDGIDVYYFENEVINRWKNNQKGVK